MQMGKVVAFALGSETNPIPVTKQWLVLDQRHVLVEQVPFKLLQAMLKELPAAPGHAGLQNSPDGVLHRVASRHLLPTRNLAQGSPSPAKSAAGETRLKGTAALTPALSRPTGEGAIVAANRKGVAIDWSTVTTQTNFTFQADSTYYVSSSVNLSATTTFEGGSIIK